jgi:hypothetical protein
MSSSLAELTFNVEVEVSYMNAHYKVAVMDAETGEYLNKKLFQSGNTL